ncbi:MAG TPA: zinc ribbon domain-containing protein [Polyangiaceae bacterium]|jgi:hypothetical protein
MRAFDLLRLAGLVLWWVTTSSLARAQQPTLAGRWNAGAMRADWAVGQWGGACGPAPSGTGAPGGIVTVTQQGSELVMSGAGRTFSTAECWEQFPGLVRTSHASGARNWHSACRTGAGDPRQASLVTSISATDTQITFDETGQYQFVINGQNCTASVRRARVMLLQQREGESPAPAIPADSAAAAALAPSADPGAKAARSCVAPGPPERLEVRPSRKLIRAGESFQFRALVLDAAGCATGATPTFHLLTPDSTLTLTSRGLITVPDNAPESTVELQASLGERSVRVEVEIASAARYDALLAQDGLNAAGESNDAAVARIATSSIGSGKATAPDDSGRRRALFVAVVGGVAMVLGLLGFVLVQRSRVAEPSPEPEPRRARLPPALTPHQPPPLGMICPTCREEYPSDVEFCRNDGNRLLPAQSANDTTGPSGGVCPVCGQGFDPGVNHCPKHGEELVPVAASSALHRESAAQIRKICPVCGKYFPGESQFCGGCGASLVQVN